MRNVLFSGIIILTFALVGCGIKGPLYMPQQTQASGGHVYADVNAGQS